MTDGESTLSLIGELEGPALEKVPVLYWVASAEGIGGQVLRTTLGGATRVRLGRGDMTRCHRQDGGAIIELSDSWLSAENTELYVDDRGWQVRDLGSKNGTTVAGQRVVDRARLTDGDLLEIGSSVLLWREQDLAPTELGDRVGDCRDEDLWLSPEFSRAVRSLDSIASSAVPVILQGETGTGKEVFARRLHARSRRQGDFIAVNCSTVAGDVANSELFGHRKGAFTGAGEDRPGLFRLAHRGTLLLDEVVELGADAQAKLLRVLQEGEVVPVGGGAPISVDVRVIAASHENLATAVSSGRFRNDLYMRLRGFELEVPPLRHRRADIGLLVARLAAKRGLAPPRFQRSALRALVEFDWPGNVRELEQVLLTAAQLADGDAIAPRHLPVVLVNDGGTESDEDRLRERVRDALYRHRGNVSAVAREIGKARVQIRRWCRRWGIDIEAYRS